MLYQLRAAPRLVVCLFWTAELRCLICPVQPGMTAAVPSPGVPAQGERAPAGPPAGSPLLRPAEPAAHRAGHAGRPDRRPGALRQGRSGHTGGLIGPHRDLTAGLVHSVRAAQATLGV